MEDNELIQMFFNESKDIIEVLEIDLDGLQSNENTPETINSIFRAFHTIKGNASFLEIINVVNIAHQGESLLDLLRSKQLELDSENIELIFSAFEALQNIIQEEDLSFDVTSYAKKIADYLNVHGFGAEKTEQIHETNLDEMLRQNTENLATELEDLVLSSSQNEENTNVADNIKETKIENDLEAMLAASNKQFADSLAPKDPEERFQGEIESLLLAGNYKKDLDAKAEKNRKRLSQFSKKSTHKKNSKAMVRIEEAKITKIMNLAQELEEFRFNLEQIPDCFDADLRSQDKTRREIEGQISKFSRISNSINNLVSGVALVPVNTIFKRFPKIVDELALKLGKKIELDILDGSAELDKNIVDAIVEPMTHLIRNAADHGIESPEERKKDFKEETGLITLNSYMKANSAVIEIRDNGRGIDSDKIVEKAIAKKILTADEASNLSIEEKFELIFAPGFSTAEEVTEISGRGVGMDVVKENMNRLKGSIHVESKLGSGTSFQLHFPLSMAVMRCLFVNLTDNEIVIPLSQIEASYRVDTHFVYPSRVDPQTEDQECLPLYYLGELLYQSDISLGDLRSIDILKVRDEKNMEIGILVDNFFHTEEFIVQAVDSYISSYSDAQGAILRKDGSVTLSIDLSGVVKKIQFESPIAYALVDKEASHEDIDLDEFLNEARKSEFYRKVLENN